MDLKYNINYNNNFMTISNTKKNLYTTGIEFFYTGKIRSIKRAFAFGFTGGKIIVDVKKDDVYVEDSEVYVDTDEQILESSIGETERATGISKRLDFLSSGPKILGDDTAFKPGPYDDSDARATDIEDIGYTKLEDRYARRNKDKYKKNMNRRLTNTTNIAFESNYNTRFPEDYVRGETKSLCKNCHHLKLRRICNLWKAPIRDQWYCGSWEENNNARSKI